MSNEGISPSEVERARELVRRSSTWQYGGSVEYSIEDEDYSPHGRRIDLRVHYNWTNYNRADEPAPVWGPTIEQIEIVAIHYFDAEGNEVSEADHQQEVAWELLQHHNDSVLDACREDGYRTGAGTSPAWYSPRRPAAAARSEKVVPRLAPSIGTREAQPARRQLG